MNENVAFAVSCDELYTPCLIGLLKSIRINQPDFNYDFWVIDSGLTKKNIKQINDLYPVSIIKCDEELYKESGKENKKFRSVEMFRITGYDKVIQLGADALLLNRVDELVKEDCDIGMPKEKRRQDMFSSGIMVIGKKYLNDETYRALLKADYSHVEMFGNDMKLYNCFFKGKITELNYYYDVVNCEWDLDCFDLGKTVFLHYCHKPQARRNKMPMWLYHLWDKYFYAKVPKYENRKAS